MIPEIETLKAQNLPDDIADAATRFLTNPDPAIPATITKFPLSWQMNQLGKKLMTSLTWNHHTRMLLRFFIHLADSNMPQGNNSGEFLAGVMQALCDRRSSLDPIVVAEATEEIRLHLSTPDAFVSGHLTSSTYGHDWSLRVNSDADAPFQNAAMNLIYQTITRATGFPTPILSQHPELLGVISLHHPAIASDWCRKSASINNYHNRSCWLQILKHSTSYDTLCVEYCTAKMDSAAEEAFALLHALYQDRGNGYIDLLLTTAERPRAAQHHLALELLLRYRNAQVIDIMTRAFAAERASDYISGIGEAPYQQLFDLMIERWNQGGETMFMNFASSQSVNNLRSRLADQLQRLGPIHYPALRKAIGHFMSLLTTTVQTDLWQTLSETHPAAFIEEFGSLLIGKSKPQREIAAAALAKIHGASALASAHDLLASKKADTRLGAIALIERIGDPASVSSLRCALEVETADAVRTAIHQALKACGANDDASAPGNFDIDSFLAKNTKGLKLPSCSWLNITSLPPIHNSEDSILPETAVTYLIAKQSKHKEIAAAPDILPLLAHIDRNSSAPFALALVEGFLNSDQAAADRWALTLGGLLGDNRIIPPLLSRINDWCENSRHKLAEYAAQAISLLPGNEPLMVLDTLSNRYRSKFKNVGKACADAFNTAATARGITADELGDMVVPNFGFDDESMRRFEWPGGSVCAELTPDFKLEWSDPESGKAWKSMPSTVPDTIKDEVKTLTKLLRETVKGQTARLELTLVRQRRWPVARWRELYENHPILRSFASSLVWGIYDATGTLLRAFRRYPNGLLADAAGSLEELPETDTMIGMVHPLEMDSAAVASWRAHLARFKVKQPFPQIDRPVELMDPLHGNRKSITLTDGKKLSAGTFKSRSEKRGWTRGSVVDAGGISSYYKLYPGAGVEVVLPLDGFYIGCDPMEEIELSAACFAKAGTVERGSYVYNEPGPDDPRILRFDQLSAVVFSETISDLKAIIATKE